jgi:hypothetical protein
LEINATGSAVDNGEAADVVGGSDSMLPLILIIVGVVLVRLIIIALLIRSRRHNGDDAGTTGFGETGAPATPEGAAPPLRAPTEGTPPAAPPMPPAAPPPPPPPPAEG